MSKQITILFLLLSAFWGGLTVFAQTDELAVESYQIANQLYLKEQYADALTLYEQLIAEGFSSPEIYLNAGHSSQKMGEAGQAADFYQRGLNLSPDSEQLKSSLEKLYESEKIIPLDEISDIRPYLLLFSVITWCIFLIALWMTVIRRTKWLIPFALFFIASGLFVAYAQIQWFTPHPKEQVITTSTQLMDMPLDGTTSLRVLPAGQLVWVYEQREAWTKVSLNEMSGWVPTEMVSE